MPKYTITAALPYANGPLHLGQIAPYAQPAQSAGWRLCHTLTSFGKWPVATRARAVVRENPRPERQQPSRPH